MATANMTMAASSDDAAANYKDYSVHDLTKILEEIRFGLCFWNIYGQLLS